MAHTSQNDCLYRDGTNANSIDAQIELISRDISSSSLPNSLENESNSSSTPFLKDGRSVLPKALPWKPVFSFQQRKGSIFKGWRAGVSAGALTAAVVLLINTALTIWGSVKFGTRDGVGVIYQGSCTTQKSLSLWIHLVINVLSTLLLSASNYTMQCLSAPTQEDVNQAHAKHIWLDIGVPSIRNLGKIRKSTLLLWWCLACSSVPLHLMHNSAVFSTIVANEYAVITVPESFINSTVVDVNVTYAITSPETQCPSYEFAPFITYVQGLQSRLATFQKLQNEECIRQYAKQFQTSRRDVVIVSEPLIQDGKPVVNIEDYALEPRFYQGVPDNPYEWICESSSTSNNRNESNPCSNQIDHITANAGNWTTSTHAKVKYCLSQAAPDQCQVQFSLYIMIFVIICNSFKVISMLIALFFDKVPPLVTIGDAVASFLTVSNPFTEDMCLISRDNFASHTRDGRRNPLWPERIPRQWRETSTLWFCAASSRRWFFCIGLLILFLLASIALLIFGISQVPGSNSIGTLWKYGLGVVNVNTLIVGWSIPSNGTGGLIADVLVANLPQTILSFLYLAYNGLYTAMMLADEWNRFGIERKALRVSNPTKDQRSTYSLQLPFRFAVPFLLLSSILHWLLSQSIFLARVSLIGWIPSRPFGVGDEEVLYSTCGYSPIAMIFVIIIGGLMLIAAIILGYRRHKPGIPLAGSNSAVISAACHAHIDDKDAAAYPVKWGVVPVSRTDDGVGHCSFSSLHTTKPELEAYYTGIKQE